MNLKRTILCLIKINKYDWISNHTIHSTLTFSVSYFKFRSQLSVYFQMTIVYFLCNVIFFQLRFRYKIYFNIGHFRISSKTLSQRFQGIALFILWQIYHRFKYTFWKNTFAHEMLNVYLCTMQSVYCVRIYLCMKHISSNGLFF